MDTISNGETTLIDCEKGATAPAVSIVIPAYNEEGAIKDTLRNIRQVMNAERWAYEILVIDDGSEDGTVKAIEKADGIILLEHKSNRGYGAALKTGIRQARADLLVIMDADGTYPPKYIPQLVEAMTDCDMAVGSRTGHDVNIPMLRKPAKWLLRKLAAFLARTDIPDLNSGLRAFRRQDALSHLGILPSGFSFTTTMTLAMLCSDMRVEYIPIDYHRREGRSKIRPFQDTAKFVLLVARTVCLFNPLRVFLPAAALLLLAGTIKLGWNVLRYDNVADLEILLMLSGLQLGAFGLLADMVARIRRLPTSD